MVQRVNSHRTTALRCPYLSLHGTGNSEDEGTSKSQPVHKTITKKNLGSEEGRKNQRAQRGSCTCSLHSAAWLESRDKEYVTRSPPGSPKALPTATRSGSLLHHPGPACPLRGGGGTGGPQSLRNLE